MGPKRRGGKTPLSDSADSSTTGNWAPPLPGMPSSPKDASASTDAGGRPRLPQAIAHRGYSAAAPENTLSAFRRAVGAGAHALETDLRLSRDGVVVLAHDPSLRRTFGEKALVRDRDWAHLAALRTLRAPGEPMARLVDLLHLLNGDGDGDDDDDEAAEGAQRVWVMLDVKRDSDPAEMMRRIAETIASVPARTRPWNERIMICCWNAAFLSESRKHLPEFKQAHVGISTTYARAVLRHLPLLPGGPSPPATETGMEAPPSIPISMLRFALASPLGLGGARFARAMRDARVPLYAWTVNGDAWMRWAVRLRLDGVVTDDPARFLEVCAEVAEEEAQAEADGKSLAARRGGGRVAGAGAGAGAGEESLVARAVEAVRFCAWIALVEIAHLVFLAYLLWKHGGPGREVRKSFER